jgi:hypothetical protein
LSRQQVAQHILKTEAARLMTAPAQAALQMLATGSKQLSAGLPTNGLPGQGLPGQQTFGAASAGAALPKPAFSNVRVNDPSLDTHQMDQTTQSETSIAVAGPRVAVGYNDSQQTGLFFTSASDLSGYSYSAVAVILPRLPRRRPAVHPRHPGLTHQRHLRARRAPPQPSRKSPVGSPATRPPRTG